MQELMATLREGDKKEDKKEEDEEEKEETEQQAPDWNIKTPGMFLRRHTPARVCVRVCVCVCVISLLDEVLPRFYNTFLK